MNLRLLVVFLGSAPYFGAIGLLGDAYGWPPQLYLLASAICGVVVGCLTYDWVHGGRP